MCDIEQQVPLTQAHRIEFPGYIRDETTAVQCLGEHELMQQDSRALRVLQQRISHKD